MQHCDKDRVGGLVSYSFTIKCFYLRIKLLQIIFVPPAPNGKTKNVLQTLNASSIIQNKQSCLKLMQLAGSVQ